ncbi:MAG: hypothetical protein JWP13_90 [Candidatus Saccharibacteria bacterium]|nr:hypothetical protein [Candidatus Saccharibacteria bacterium]
MSLLLVADGQEPVAWVFLNDFTFWEVNTLWALILTEVVDWLFFSAAKCNLLGIQVVCNTFRIHVLVCHYKFPSLMVSNGTPKILWWDFICQLLTEVNRDRPLIACDRVMYYTRLVSIKIKGRVYYMDFRSRGVQTPTTPAGNSSASSSTSSSNNKRNWSKWLERGSLLLLVSVAVIILAIAGLTYFSGNAEEKAVKDDKFQAVFLNNGQVYFGNIKDLNGKYINLNNIYYLQTSGANGQAAAATTDSSNVSLVKLGCELHAPYDQMVINRDQVIFWENLKDDSQVAKAIAQYKKDNPNGQTCSTTSQNSTQQAPSTSTQSTTTPSTTTNTTKKP